MDLLRLYLLAGLVTHKLVWEVLKRRQRHVGTAPDHATPIGLRLIKGVKIAILAGLIAQTFLPAILPIASASFLSRSIGTALFTLGLCVALLGRTQLGDNWADIEDAQILQHQTVVAAGVYRYIRHPIYIGDLVMLIGYELALGSWLVLAVAGLLPYVAWRALREEEMLAQRLPGYRAYCEQSARFVPFLF